MDTREARGWLRTVFTKQQHCTARATQGYSAHLHRALHRYRTGRRRTDIDRADEHVSEMVPRAMLGWAMQSRCEHIPIQTLVSGKEGFLRKRIIVALTYVVRPKNDTHMFGNAAIVADQTYRIRTKPVPVSYTHLTLPTT